MVASHRCGARPGGRAAEGAEADDPQRAGRSGPGGRRLRLHRRAGRRTRAARPGVLIDRRPPETLYVAPALRHQPPQRFDPIRLCRGLVGADACDAREAHRDAGLVPGGGVDRIERDLQHQRLLHFAHWAEALHRMAAHEAVEHPQFLVGDPRIGLADRQQLALFGPAAEGIVAVIGRSPPVAALRVHHHAIGGQRIALPFVPQAGAPPTDIGAVAAFQHHALDRRIARAGADRLQFREAVGRDHLAEIEAIGIEPRHERLQPVAPLRPR
ncbi:hypothetical protein WR25_02291 [Diploscapter pachys]|uniref:Uncharacterized protein n=1 Tax=Diploscapter pachys TaxID=2018661 RepID=A0A2A2M3J2_9BILA|nr:hypothetical protein WR25_02291 [Diploscapter pachys]